MVTPDRRRGRGGAAAGPVRGVATQGVRGGGPAPFDPAAPR